MATSGNDNVLGGSGDDTINALAGDDTINPGLGKDEVDGDVGTDLLVVDYSGNTYAGSAQILGIHFSFYDPTLGNGSFYAYKSDTDYNSVSFSGIERFNITGTSQADYLIDPAGGNSTLAGGAGLDTLAADLSRIGTNQIVTSAGTLADGTIHSGMERFIVTTGAGNDSFTLTGAFNDTLASGAGNDTIRPGLGNDQVDGGAGTDLLVIDYSANTYAGGAQVAGIHFSSYDANLGNGSFYAYKSDTNYDSVSFSGIERFNIKGTSQDDSLIDPAGGNSTLAGGAGIDVLAADLSRIGTNQIVTSAGTLADGTIQSGIERFNVTTGAGNDSFTLTGAFNDTLASGAGNDAIRAGLGNDQVDGGAGTDLLVIDYSANTYAGGAQVAGIHFSSYDATLGNGSFYAYKSDTNYDSVSFSGIERFNIKGTSQDDSLIDPAGGNSTLAGGAGIDVLAADLSRIGTNQIVTSAGTLADGTIHSGIERFNVTTGIGNDSFTLTRVFDDTLGGGAGNDTINPGLGKDQVDGGADTDLLVVDYSGNSYAGGAQVTGIHFSSYDTALGNGSLYANKSDTDYDTVSFSGIERFNIKGTTQGDVLIDPHGGMIDGDTANNSTLSGGSGNDTLVADLSVIATSQTLGPSGTLADGTIHTGFESFNVTTGGGDDSIALNRIFNDTLSTGLGNDTINSGRGKDGVDAGTGNDVLVVDYSTNTYTGGVQNPGIHFSSLDTQLGNGSLYAYFSDSDFDQIGFSGVERFQITGTTAGDSIIGGIFRDTLDGGLGNDTINGGAGIDSLIGGKGNDSLDGGSGVDTLAGGVGNDTYFMNGDGDVIIENLAEGDDFVESSATYTLPENVERLTLNGASALNGTGNTLNNVITGNSAANNINGGGGKDTMIGGAGDDTYTVNSSADVVTETAANGTDQVSASATFTLPENVENLILTGPAAIDGTGNGLTNLIIGNNGANHLDGTGALLGIGEKDTLTGAGGADVFVLGTAAGRYYDDRNPFTGGTGDYAYVTDLSRAQGDKLQLKGSAADYILGASPISGLAGKGLFLDSDASGTLTANDELIAVIKTLGINLGPDVNYVP